MKPSMYERLLELPLFQGLGADDLTRIVETVRVGFLHYPAGSLVVEDETPCTRLLFLVEGRLRQETFAINRTFSLAEHVAAPSILQPEALYGLHPHYSHRYTAETDVCMLAIAKQAVNTTLMQYEVVRLNILNLLSTRVYRTQRQLWHPKTGNTEQRIVRFFVRLASSPAGEKIIYIKMEDLAQHLNETRLNISRALNRMQTDGLVVLRRKTVIIPAIEKLLAHYK